MESMASDRSFATLEVVRIQAYTAAAATMNMTVAEEMADSTKISFRSLNLISL